MCKGEMLTADLYPKKEKQKYVPLTENKAFILNMIRKKRGGEGVRM